MNSTNNHKSRLLLYMSLILMLAITAPSCKSKKKLAEKEAAEAQARKIAKAKADLQSIISDDDMSLNEKKQTLATIKDMEIDDEEVKLLIAEAESKIEQLENDAMAKQLEKAKNRELSEGANTAGSLSLSDRLGKIAASGDNYGTTNSFISETLSLFESEEVPVLIIISEENGQKDYDKPTTIKKYLEYLKDKKKVNEEIYNVVYNDQGKIKELELKKRY